MALSVNQKLLTRLNAAGVPFALNKKLSELTTFRIGGPCPVCVECVDEDSLCQALGIFRSLRIHAAVIGEGSNLLVSDQGLPRPVIRFVSKACEIQQESSDEISVSASVSLDSLAKTLIDNSISNYTFLSGIPGTLGGAVVGNAGAFGRQIGDSVAWADVITQDGRKARLKTGDLKFSYRDSVFKHRDDYSILRVGLKTIKGDKASLLKERKDILELRHQKHPDYKKTATAGSFFKNIVTADGKRLAAGKFLDEAGCKTLTVGDAGVFSKHANIVVNKKKATCKDVIALAKLMRECVEEKFKIRLEPEVRVLGTAFR